MKRTIAVLLMLVLTLGLFACLSACGSKDKGGAPAADDKVYTFTLSMHDPKTTANAVYIQSWIDSIDKRRNSLSASLKIIEDAVPFMVLRL